MATKRMKLSGRAPERCGRYGQALAGRYARRGNAMIMAVALTVLLAIIGSSFVLMSRLDRQTVRNAGNVVVADAALEAVVALIQKQMAADMFQTNATTGVQSLKTQLYDYPGDAADQDHWLASSEPVANTIATPTEYSWRHVSDLLGNGVTLRIDTPPNGAVDVDGDGIVDSILLTLPGVTTADGKSVQFAVRIVDNCGKVNVNTAWKRGTSASGYNYARLADMDSYGEYLHQVDIYRLLNRYGIKDPFNDTLGAHNWLVNAQNFKSSGTNDFDVQSVLWQDLVIGGLSSPGLFPFLMQDGKSLRAFGLEDEFELGNRGCINSTTQTPLEQALGTSQFPLDAIGLWNAADPTAKAVASGYRILPYDPSEVGRWFLQMTNDPSLPTQALNTGNRRRAEQRHLLTTINATREVRPSLPLDPAPSVEQLQAEQFLDGTRIIAGLNSGLGKYRKVNINRVLEVWLNPDPLLTVLTPVQVAAKLQAVLRLAKAFEAAGYTFDQGLQYTANLIDYVDADNIPTVFPYSVFQAFGNVTRDIVGVEQQPVITEVYNELDGSPTGGKSINAAVEIYNPPYNRPVGMEAVGAPLNLAAWELRFGSTAIAVPETIPPGQRFVYVRDRSAVTTPTTIDTSYFVTVVSKSGADINRSDLDNLKFDLTGATALQLVRPVKSIWGTTHDVLVDQVSSADMSALATGSSVTHSIWRGLSDPNPALAGHLAPWGCTRNVFCAPVAGMHHLGTINKVTNPDDLLNIAGTPIRVDSRGPVANGIPVTVNTAGAMKPSVQPMPNYMWRVHGWYELGRVLLVGNEALGGTGAGARKAITDLVEAAGEAVNDVNKDGLLDSGDTMIRDLNSNSGFDRGLLDEKQLRLDMTSDKFARLMERISFFSTADDGIDNDNSDGDSYPTATVASGVTTITDPGLFTGADDLKECRLPGQINVNTAPEAVLRAIFPALITYAINPSTLQPSMTTGTPSLPAAGILGDASNATLTQELDTLSSWLARAIVWERTQHGAYTSLSNLLLRIDALDTTNVPVLADLDQLLPPISGAVPYHAGALRFGVMLDAVRAHKSLIGWDASRGRLAAATPVGSWQWDNTYPVANPQRELGGWLINGDFEDRDWIFSRMAGLMTVRSDVFTAYILIRIGGTESADQRYVATFDRSNVFLPEAAGHNAEPFVDNPSSPNGVFDAGEDYTDLNGNGVWDGDDSGEMALFDPMGAKYGLPTSANPNALGDFDYFDRQYTTPQVVAIRQVPDAR